MKMMPKFSVMHACREEGYFHRLIETMARHECVFGYYGGLYEELEKFLQNEFTLVKSLFKSGSSLWEICKVYCRNLEQE